MIKLIKLYQEKHQFKIKEAIKFTLRLMIKMEEQQKQTLKLL